MQKSVGTCGTCGTRGTWGKNVPNVPKSIVRKSVPKKRWYKKKASLSNNAFWNIWNIFTPCSTCSTCSTCSKKKRESSFIT